MLPKLLCLLLRLVGCCGCIGFLVTLDFLGAWTFWVPGLGFSVVLRVVSFSGFWVCWFLGFWFLRLLLVSALSDFGFSWFVARILGFGFGLVLGLV